MQKSNVFYLILVLIIVIVILIYNTYTFKNRVKESFENNQYDLDLNNINNTTLNAFINGKDFISDPNIIYNNYQYVDIQQKRPLLTFGCINTDPENNEFNNYLQENFLTSSIEFYSLSINDIYERIVDDIRKVKQLYIKNNQFIESPIYIIIYQAPYLNVYNREFQIKGDIFSNMKMSMTMTNDDILIGKKEIFTKIQIIYSKYKLEKVEEDIITNGTIEYNVLNIPDGNVLFKNYIEDKITRNKLCFIDCNSTGSDYKCGCLSKEKQLQSIDYKSYNSKCLNENNKSSNYGMVYMLNKYNKIFEEYLH